MRAGLKFTISVTMAVTLLLPPIPAPPEAGDLRIGDVTRTKAAVSGELGGVRRKLRKSLPIFQNEEIRTGSDARAVLRFRDGSVLKIGADAEVLLDDYVYKGTGGVIRLVKGALRFTSGPRGRPGLSFRSPVATIGIRGTDFWVGKTDDGYGVLLLSGKVTVSNRGGYVVLDQPSEGTFISSASAAPSAPSLWSGGQQESALADVAITPGPLCRVLEALGKGHFGSCS